ncbi:MAG TPA: site-specific integrase [Solirubrobacter sp.]|nr:site-specific integrase [Solirubrobacter sp.]
MQARKPSGYLSGSVRLSSTVKGKPRKGGPVWEARYRLPNGKDSTKVIGPAWRKRGRPPEGYFTQATAEAWLRAFLAEQEAASAISGPAVPFKTVALAYLADCERRIAAGDLRQTTFRTYRNIVAGPPLTDDGKRRKRSRETPGVTPLLALWGDRPVETIGEGDVEEYRDGLVERGLAPSTLNQHRAVVRGIFALAVARFGATTNPGLAFEWAKSRRGKSDAISFYRPDEVQLLARTAKDDQDRAIFIVAAFTGLRLSELRALRWRSVDHDDALVHVERGYTDDGGENLPKSYRVRSVPMMPQVAAVLTALRTREHFTGDDDLVFVNTVGGPIDGAALYRRYVKAAEAAGLRRLRFHDLRHSFGTMAVREFPITDVQEWMGHADIATTRKYVHYAPRRGAAKRLGALVGDETRSSLALAA